MEVSGGGISFIKRVFKKRFVFLEKPRRWEYTDWETFKKKKGIQKGVLLG